MKGNRVAVPPDAPLKNQVYRHYKGDLYKVCAVALHANDDVWMVVYEPLYDDSAAPLFTRPVSQWQEMVEHNGVTVSRFCIVPGHE